MINREILATLFLHDVEELRGADSAAIPYDPTPEAIKLYAVRRQYEGFFKKRVPTSGVSASLQQLASETFSVLNARCSSWKPPLDRAMLLRFLHAKAWIAEVLPPLSFVEEEVFSLCCFGPGVTFSQGGPKGRHLISKVGNGQSVTALALPIFIRAGLKHWPAWLDTLNRARGEIVKGNRSAYVPKDVRKCRRIAVEPSLNLFLQQGVGKWLSRRLRLFGVDLRDQERNRTLARLGSLDGSYATLDLSNASDTISTELVRWLLPPDWFELLNALRSQFYWEDGEWHPCHSFSSQGNAFTFPLETMIFLSLGRAVTDFVSAYGDDLICDSASYHDLCEILEVAGFTVNLEKSYGSGPFRESCGGDYLLGQDVRPVYYREDATRPSDVVKLHNLLIERWGSLPKVQEYLLALVKKPLFGPRYFIADSMEVAAMFGKVDLALSKSAKVTPLGINHIVTLYDAFFWKDDAESGRYRMYRSRPAPPREEWLSSWTEEALLRANLYAMRDVSNESSLQTHEIVSRWLTVGGMLSDPLRVW